VWERVRHLPSVEEFVEHYPSDYRVKRSIFWELPFWVHVIALSYFCTCLHVFGRINVCPTYACMHPPLSNLFLHHSFNEV